MRFAEQTVVITGGASGIGRVMARRFATEGASVVVADLLADKAAETVAEIEAAGGRALATRSDVTVAADVDEMVRAAEDTFGPVDVLVNNAYSCRGDNVVLMDEETWGLDLAGVVTSAFLCSKRVLPEMIERKRGVIVNIASVNGLAYVGNEAYSAGKAAMINLTQSIAVRYGHYGVRCVAIAPGSIATAGLGRAGRARARRPRAARQVVPPAADRNARGHRQRRALPRFGRGVLDHRDRAPGRRRPPRGQRDLHERAPRRVAGPAESRCSTSLIRGRARHRRGREPVVRSRRRRPRRPHRHGRAGATNRPRAPSTRTGSFVCPGFTDMHTHSDIQLLVNPAHEVKVHQGVTCDVIGQDGLSFAPVTDDVLAQLRVQLAGWNDDPPGIDWGWRVGERVPRPLRQEVAINAAFLVPHGTVRMVAMGSDDRPPTAAELAEMKRLVREGIEQGAVGLSSGLTYAPGMYASDDELVELCSAMRGTGGFYCPHHRNYGSDALAAYRDCIEIARRAGVPLHYAHAHLGFPVNRGKAPELLAMVDAARADGVDVTMDTYPYLAGSTYLHAYLPGWSLAGGPEATIARLRDPGLRERLRVEMEETGSDGAHGVPIDWSAARRQRRAPARTRTLDRQERRGRGCRGREAPDRLLLRAHRGRRARRLGRLPHRQRGERPR